MAKFLDQAGLVTLWAQIKGLLPEGTIVTETSLVETLSNYVTTKTLNTTVEELEKMITEEASKVFTFKGSVSTYADLPTENQQIGDVYNIETADPDEGILAGDNVVWTGDTWDKLAGTIDLSAYATKEYVEDNYVPFTVQGTNGQALIQNEPTGGGSKFHHNDGTESFVGVNDGGANGMVAQIYADKNVDGNWIGSRLNVYQKGMFYHNAEDKASEDYVADDPAHEIATLGDIQGTQETIESLPDTVMVQIVNVSRTETTNTAEVQIATKQPDGTYSTAEQHGVLTLVSAGEVPGAGSGAGLMSLADKQKLDGIDALTEEEIEAICT